MKLLDELKLLSSEKKIQYIYNILNTKTDYHRKNIAFLLKNDRSPIVRHEAAYIFGELDGKDCSEYLIDAINNDSNRFVIHEALLALSNQGSEESRKIIENQIPNPEKDISDTALISLERLNLKLQKKSISLIEAKHMILDLNCKMEERIQSSFVLMNEGSEDSLNILISAYKQEPNSIVKHEIIFSLGETSSKQAAERLSDGIKLEINDFVIHETLLALSTLGFKEHCNVIKDYVNHPSLEVAESAEIALERLNCKVL